uniref:Protein lethal(2)essential for life n=1 Tax=Parasteatoda tepidariorum TaxID=114398 RepID=A0A2L2ZA55_PARTP
MSSTTRTVISRNVRDDGIDFPSRIRAKLFGLGLTDLDLDAPSSFIRGYYLRPRRLLSSGGLSEIMAESVKF